MDDTEEAEGDNSPTTEVAVRQSTMTQSQTYESELDQVLEELSDAEITTLHSDNESVLSLKCINETTPKHTREATTLKNHKTFSNVLNRSSCYTEQRSGSFSHNTTNRTMLTSVIEDNSRSCKSLPRNVKNLLSTSMMNYTLDNMGSWPRKLNKADSKTPNNSESTKSTSSCKRRSLSPGKLKSLAPEQNERIHSLIEEARRMSINKQDQLLEMSDLVSPYASVSVVPASEPTEHFIRKPSYRIACSDTVKPRRPIPRSQSEELSRMRRNYSYKKANSFKHQMSDSILESHDHVDSEPSQLHQGLVRAPSYRIAQSQSFDRGTRAPSYRKALETIPYERDSGLGSHEMTSSSDSCGSVANYNRQPSYRMATESSSQDIQVLNQRAIRECLKGVYENEEKHLSVPKPVLSKPEFIQINHSHHYAIPRMPAQSTSFNPEYVNILVNGHMTQQVTNQTAQNKKSLQASRSAPQTQGEDNSSKIEGTKSLVPGRNGVKKDRPISSYIPNETEENDSVVPDNRLMLPKYNMAAFTSMEMLKREEMAVKSILGKIRQSTRPVSFVETDI